MGVQAFHNMVEFVSTAATDVLDAVGGEHGRARAAWPICDRPEDVVAFVVGGPRTHGVFLPSFGPTTSVTRRLEGAAGSS